MIQTYHIRIERMSDDPEYGYFSFYNVSAPNKQDAGIKARKQFCEDFGAPFKGTKVGYCWDAGTHVDNRYKTI